MNKQVKLNKDGSIKSRGIEWTDYERGWIAGVIDSEGHISLVRDSRPSFKAGYTYKPTVGIANNKLDFILYAQSLVGGAYHLNKANNVYNLVLKSASIKPILENLHLIIKDKQRLLLLDAIEIISRRTGRGIGPRTDDEISRLEQLHIEIRTLNNTVHRMKNEQTA